MKKHYKNKKGQFAGWAEDGVFRKRVQGSKHQLRKPPAWGVDEDIFQSLEVSEIRIQDTETVRVYKAPYSVWKERGFTQDRGHGLQRFLLLTDFGEETEHDFEADVKAFDEEL